MKEKTEKLVEDWKQGKINREELDEYIDKLAGRLEETYGKLRFTRAFEAVLGLILLFISYLLAVPVPVLTHVPGTPAGTDVPWWYNPFVKVPGIMLNPVSLTLFVAAVMLVLHALLRLRGD